MISTVLFSFNFHFANLALHLDGSSGHSHYRYDDDTGTDETSQNTIFASVLVGLAIIATSPTGQNEILWDNALRNSPFAVMPLRFAFEPESFENAYREGARLRHELETLIPFNIPGTDIHVQFTGMPTLVDGKMKAYWNNIKGMNNCSRCGATPKELRLRHLEKFQKPIPELLKFGLQNLHVLLRAWDWFTKTYTYQDIRSYQCP